jgi:hypothetical protein
LPSTWFSAARAVDVSVALRDEANAANAASTTLPQLMIRQQPDWWDASLRTATLGNGLIAPAGVDNSGAVFLSLPVSPVHPAEAFAAYMYVNTAGLPLNTWRVRLYFGNALLDYLGFEQSTHFNAASASTAVGEVSWLVTGRASSSTASQVTGGAVFLIKINMRVNNGIAGGVYEGSALALYPRATELISGGAFAQNTDGMVFDARDGAQVHDHPSHSHTIL